MSVIRIRQSLRPFLYFSKKSFSSSALIQENEYTETPEYPPILDVSRDAEKQRTEVKNRLAVRKIKTIEEKQIKINMPKYYGFRSFILDGCSIPYNSLSFFQHITKTHMIQQNDLPMYYNNLTVDFDSFMESLKTKIEDVISFEYKCIRKKPLKGQTDLEIERLRNKSLIKHVNRIIINTLVQDYPHLLKSQVDVNPRHEAFWFAGGLLQQGRHNIERSQAMQYIAYPHLTLRNDLPLEPIILLNEAEDPSFDVPVHKCYPGIYPFNKEHRHAANIPGFWPGDKSEFGLLSYYDRDDKWQPYNEKYQPDDFFEMYHSKAIIHSFSWLLSQANYQGFTIYNDLTYPLVNQSVITNGQMWSFYVYQLNTIIMQDDESVNKRKNVCWGTLPMKLFEGFDDNGKVIGLNTDVLKTLMKFYVNVPKIRENVNMKPYLEESEKVIADINEDGRRNWLEETYKILMSNRERHRLTDEIYHWEKIYKIDHKTRPMDAKRRPFELGVSIYNKRLDDYRPKYVPKANRPEEIKSKRNFKKFGRLEKTYYP